MTLQQQLLTSSTLDSLHGLSAPPYGTFGARQPGSGPSVFTQLSPPIDHGSRLSTRATKPAHPPFPLAQVDNRRPDLNLRKKAIAQEPPAGRCKAKKSKDLDSSPEKSSSVVRRSARVRDKRVNYAVDDAGSIGGMDSMSPSPQKSDVSAFSPEKSDASDTPVRSRNIRREPSSFHDALLGRGNSILANTIEAQKQKESSDVKQKMASPSKKRRVETSAHDHRHPGMENHHQNNLLANRFNFRPWATRDAANFLFDQTNGLSATTDGMAQAPNADTTESGLLEDYNGHPVQDSKPLDTIFGTTPLASYETPIVEDRVKQSTNSGLPGHLQFDEQPFFRL